MVHEVYEKNVKHADYFICPSSVHSQAGLLASHFE